MSRSLSSVEMIFWRSRTVFSACTRSRSRAAISNFSSAAAVSICAVSSWASPSFLPSRKRSTSRTVRSYPSRVSRAVQGALHRWM